MKIITTYYSIAIKYADGTSATVEIDTTPPEMRIEAASLRYETAKTALFRHYLHNTTLIERMLNVIGRTLKLFLWDLPTR